MLRASLVEDDVVVVRRAVNPLFAVNGPLASFWSKTQMVYALGLLTTKHYDRIETIRKLRNKFAHSHAPVDFETPGYKELSSKLIDEDVGTGPPESPPTSEKTLSTSANSDSVAGQSLHGIVPRLAFIMVVANITGWLSATEVVVRHVGLTGARDFVKRAQAKGH